MPSIVPSYLYTFFALALVGTILIGTFSSLAASLKQIPEEKQLRNVLDYVAAKSLELVNSAVASGGNVTLQAVLELPARIGQKQYWVKLESSSEWALAETGFGTTPMQPIYEVYLSSNISASGTFVGGFGKAVLTLVSNSSGIFLSLGSLEG